MAAVTTERLLGMALELVGWSEPTPDCAIYYAGGRISHILVGLDVGVAELFLARQLGFHAVVAHASAGLVGPGWEVYRRHVEQLVAVGVAPEVAEQAVAPRVEELRSEALRRNNDHIASVARLLEIPLLSIPTPLDERARRAIQSRVDETLARRPAATVAELRLALLPPPPFAGAWAQPQLLLGELDAPAGRVVVAHAAYAPPTEAVARAYFAAGVQTLIVADFALDDARRLARDGAQGNILALGRAATANQGVRPYVARLREEGVEVATFSGVTDTETDPAKR